jgi:hypothetical protein
MSLKGIKKVIKAMQNQDTSLFSIKLANLIISIITKKGI